MNIGIDNLSRTKELRRYLNCFMFTTTVAQLISYKVLLFTYITDSHVALQCSMPWYRVTGSAQNK